MIGNLSNVLGLSLIHISAEIFRENEVLTLADIKQLKKNYEATQQIPGQMDISPMEEQQEAAGTAEGATGNETDQQQEETATEGAGEALSLIHI